MKQKNQKLLNPALVGCPSKEAAEVLLKDCQDLAKHDGIDYFLFAIVHDGKQWIVSICDKNKPIDDYRYVCPECLKGAHTHSSN
jgi:hypothetical protein